MLGASDIHKLWPLPPIYVTLRDFIFHNFSTCNQSVRHDTLDTYLAPDSPQMYRLRYMHRKAAKPMIK